MYPVRTTLKRIAHNISDGDLLLFRGTSLGSRVIGAYGRSTYSHAGMVGYCRGIPMCLEIRELRGGRAVTLESQVQRYPGRIDVYTVAPEFMGRYNGEIAAAFMMLKCGRKYSYTGIVRAFLRHLPFVRVLCKPDMLDGGEGGDAPEFCSEAVASAARLGGGVDPVANAADRITEPGDLARSLVWRHRWTLEAP